ncbi:MAG: type IV pilus twitching motility protein PilT [Synergistaceae bacterium]|nr:type IV pilus twitching motility protein PilT [Synergistaceae bacterium]
MAVFDINNILLDGVMSSASDIHLCALAKPALRVNGVLTRRPYSEPLTKEDMDNVVNTLLSPEQLARFKEDREFDFSFDFTSGTDFKQRFRGNFSFERGNIVLALRIITPIVRTVKQLMLPDEVRDIAHKNNGLFIVTGPTGSGKSTTLAAIIQEINLTRPAHVITIEDPIEYIYESAESMIHQREVGSDTKSFSEALRRAMRQDPDVIMIGELRDLETISAAVTAAETGHLVLTTLHTPDAPQSIDRIIDVFPAGQQQQIRIQLASILIGILSQQLVPLITETGRMVVTELLIANNAIKNYIREAKTSQIKNALQTGSALGMHTMDQDLSRMYREGLISRKTAIAYAYDLKDLERFMGD